MQQELHRYLASSEEGGRTFCLIVVCQGENKRTRFDVTTALVNYQTTKSSKTWLTSSLLEMGRLKDLDQKNVYVLRDAMRGYSGIDTMTIIDKVVMENCEPPIMALSVLAPMSCLYDTFCVLVIYLKEEEDKDSRFIGGFQEYARISEQGFAIVQTVNPLPHQI